MNDLRSQYPCRCPVCEKTFFAKPSPLMQQGENVGYTVCPHCGSRLLLSLSEAGEMTAAPEGE